MLKEGRRKRPRERESERENETPDLNEENSPINDNRVYMCKEDS